MSQPTPYNRLYSFTDFQTVNPTDPLPATELDAELNAIALTAGQIRANLGLIQRDDGALANQSVTPDSLSTGALAMIHQGEYAPRGAWGDAVAYVLGDVVTYNAATYLCIVAHTSVTQFATDLAAGKWLLIANGALTGGGQAVDLFEGNGSTTAFTLSFTYAGNNAAVVFVGGVAQIPGQDFTISGTTITFVAAPPAPAVAGRKNVMVRGTGVEAQLAADLAATSATNAGASATAAANSASAASASQTAAAASQTAAAGSATSAAASATTATNQASTATTQATNAANSATAAAASQSAAATSATNAANSATAAAGSATTATTQATTATNQATAAANSATAASNSATAAAGSASTASGAATTATTQASNASTSATAASTSATNAANSASQASTSASNAAASASSASSSSSSASTSATNAAASATTATTQATAAGASAAAALASQNAAATSATNASTSATNSANSATASASSASSAAASATAASASQAEAANSAASINDANLVHKTGDEAIDGNKTFSGNVGGAFVRGVFTKATPSAVAFIKTGATTATTSSTIYVEVNGTVKTIASGTSVTMPALSAGTDYAIWAKPDGSLEATSNHTSPPVANSRKIGGFHYAPGGNASGQSGGNTTAQINEYSFWDLKFKPSCPDPRGMTLVAGGFWMDIYLTGVDAITNGSSRYNVTMADGSSPPKVPAMFGGNGSTTYGSYTWFEAMELAAAFGKRAPTQREFMAATYGTTEASSVGTDQGSTVLNAAYTSRWGVVQSSGVLWIWGDDRGGAYNTGGWNANTEGRGSEYNAPNAVLLGGDWGDGASAGSRCSHWNIAASDSNTSVGSRFCCDHLQLD